MTQRVSTRRATSPTRRNASTTRAAQAAPGRCPPGGHRIATSFKTLDRAHATDLMQTHNFKENQ